MHPSAARLSTRQHLFLLLFVASLARIATMLHFQTYSPEPHGAAWGFETGMISRSLAEGHGFASPFGGNTGPTAWFPPLHPALQALVFKVFGIQTTSSAVVMRLFNISCTLGSCVLIFRICRRLWGERFAFLASWIWALYPRSIWFDVTLISYGVVSVFLLLAAIDLAISFHGSRKRDWARQGLLWGVIALTNPSLLSLLPICWLLAAIDSGQFFTSIRGFAISSLLLFALVFPWTLRNYLAFGAWIPVRGNMGHELYKGNHWGANGEADYALNPWNNPAELREYQRVGEREYVRQHKQIAMRFIRENPSGALRLFRRRIYLFWDLSNVPKTFEVNEKIHAFVYLWVGLLGLLGILFAIFAQRKRDPHALSHGMPHAPRLWSFLMPTSPDVTICLLFAAIVIVYPLPYYITFPIDRYRLIIEPILLIFALHLFTGFRAFRPRPSTEIASAAAGPPIR